MNKFIGIGRLTRDIELRFTQAGKAVASFTIAIDSGYGDNKRTDFVPIVAWEKLAEVCSSNLSKGRKILVEGRLQISEYEKDGQKRRSTDIVAQNIEFLDSKQAGSGTNSNANQGSNNTGKSGYDVSSFGTEVFPEEEIPF